MRVCTFYALLKESCFFSAQRIFQTYPFKFFRYPLYLNSKTEPFFAFVNISPMKKTYYLFAEFSK